ncbi:MAG TPA: bifunctional methylenetetrahydrofolate dehydrogenase/methenyltetrahydrofolate cyclohydrolase FolD [Nitriliruptorales bacterium]|nr:bifunctional methylenetetrahydrofolate dehydrogenase/methenyltetrahydrofolate cyclohydrolase FolD [Nitriliruptorales bacterium]
MTARILDGRALATRLRARIAEEVAALQAEHGVTPGLAAVLVGDDPASRVYVDMKHRDSQTVGIHSRQVELPAHTTQAELLAVIDELNRDDTMDGILVQLPLPLSIAPATIQEATDPQKDVDGLHPVNAGRLLQGDPTFVPCTPSGVLELLRDGGVELAGARVAVIGRSPLVGRPLSVLLGLKGTDATVVQCHSRTRDLPGECRRADVIVAAVGVPHLVLADWVQPGAVVVDVGTNRLEDGRLVGDVDFEHVQEVAGAITPVPGGVGPMTRAMLLRNTVEGARARRGLPRRPSAEAATVASDATSNRSTSTARGRR